MSNCIDCGKQLIGRHAVRCRKCSNTGKNNPMCKNGEKLPKYSKCIDCGKQVSYGHLRCNKCYHKYNIGKNHPRYGKTGPGGFSGKHHSKESKIKIREHSYNKGKTHEPYYPKPWFISILNHKVRSTYEEKVAIILKQNNILYAYEKPFGLIYPDGSKHTYFADFVLIDYDIVIETKGFLREDKEFKYKIFREQYLDYKFIIVGTDEKLKEHCDEFVMLSDFEKYIKDRQYIK